VDDLAIPGLNLRIGSHAAALISASGERNAESFAVFADALFGCPI
jgi:hypothetical protein